MRLFLARSDTAFPLLRAVDDAASMWRGGTPVMTGNGPVSLAPADGAADDFVPVDCFTMIDGVDGVVVSDYARGVLRDLLREAGEFVPVRVMGQPYWWFNCLACVDALDRERTDAEWAKVGGEWGAFEWIVSSRRLEFRADALCAAPSMFRVLEFPQGVVLASDALVERVEQSGLTGFRFDLVWSRDAGGVNDPPGLGMAGILDEPDRPALQRRRDEARRVLSARST